MWQTPTALHPLCSVPAIVAVLLQWHKKAPCTGLRSTGSQPYSVCQCQPICAHGLCLLHTRAACKPIQESTHEGESHQPLALLFPPARRQLLRISEEDEHRGLDVSKHGGNVYNGDNFG